MAKKETKTVITGQSIKEKLQNIYKLQLIDSEIDRIKIMRGELPLEVRDLEDEIEGLETRIKNLETELENSQSQITARENGKKEADALIKRYTEQQNNVRNNREYDALTKEIEFQNLEIQLCDKKIREHTEDIETKTVIVNDSKIKFEERYKDLEVKKSELDKIIAETKKDEEKLNKERETIATKTEARLLYAYSRIRNNVLNKMAVATIERDACGGCFNKIPPQRQIDIKSSRKIIPCEYCGRILVDPEILEN
ncbi:MAG: C4-type zinc ribbon domain-containing protein [Bacteroidales bacterium]|nr:C4-type zinc ribbon domain-containing protein [Bacteroidales bacterium]MDD4216746.1 C4-type zinc ribbon domain-containing protein [Bacteroidales bacterium]MDY0140409.1 C4-type zinc ribbon domain-containing protein [Bacteroidales bacterium]